MLTDGGGGATGAALLGLLQPVVQIERAARTGKKERSMRDIFTLRANETG
jgi:hypothetical protein